MSNLAAGLKPLCIIGLFLASLGMLSTCASGITVWGQIVLAQQEQSLHRNPAGDAPHQQTAEQGIQDFNTRTLPINLLLLVWQAATILLLIVAGISGLRMTLSSLSWLRWAMINGLTFEIIRGIVTVYFQLQLYSILTNGQPAGPSAQNANLVLVAFMFALPATLLIIKLAYYGWGLWLTTHPETRAWFGEIDPELDRLEGLEER